MNTSWESAEEKELNRRWLANVRPPDWKNPRPVPKYDLVVLGAGSAGLPAALAAARFGAKVALVEARRLGGDCLNTGSVPTQGLVKAARLVRELRRAGDLGVTVSQPVKVDFSRVMERVRRLRSETSWNESAARAAGLGVDVFFGTAVFRDDRTVSVDGVPLCFTKALIATGSRPAAPEVPGLAEAGYWTRETVFEIRRRPAHLAVLGGGSWGCEIAQAFLRLGSRVLLLQPAGQLLAGDDADAAQLVLAAFKEESMDVVLSAKLLGVERRGSKKIIRYVAAGQQTTATVEEILLATAPVAGVEGLNLEKARVDFNRRTGVKVDEFLQTSNPRIYAAGEVCALPRTCQAAAAMGYVAMRNALFPGKRRWDFYKSPGCTFTDPEIAQVGLSEQELKAAGIPYKTFMQPLAETDRAMIDGETAGFIKLNAHRRTRRLLGATLAGGHAGELLSPISLAMEHGLKLEDLANLLTPYPTQSNVLRQAARAAANPRLTPGLKPWFARWLGYQRGK